LEKVVELALHQHQLPLLPCRLGFHPVLIVEVISAALRQFSQDGSKPHVPPNKQCQAPNADMSSKEGEMIALSETKRISHSGTPTTGKCFPV
jgi:hypothetical protein